MTVDGRNSTSLTWDGSAETDGSFILLGKAGSAVNDTLKGGSGNDKFVYAATGDLFNGNQIVDTIVGGAGSGDAIVINNNGGATFTIASGDNFTNGTRDMATVEAIVAGEATDQVISITLHADAATDGITTINLSADTDATSTNVIDLSNLTSTVAMTVVGSAGIDNITVDAESPTTITAGGGIDTIDLGATSAVSSVIVGTLAADADVINNFITSEDTLDVDALMDGTTKSYYEGAMGADVYGAGENVFVVSDNTDIAALAAQIAGDTDVNATKALMVFDNGSDTYVYYTDNAAGDGTEMLIATLAGISDATGLGSADFVFA